MPKVIPPNTMPKMRYNPAVIIVSMDLIRKAKRSSKLDFSPNTVMPSVIQASSGK